MASSIWLRRTRLEGRHRDHATVFLYGDGAISLRQQQRVRALHRLAPRPAARVAGLALAELRVPGRLAIADLAGSGCVL